MSEYSVLDYIPVIGDIYRYGKVGYNIGSWLANNGDSYNNDVLSNMANYTNQAANSDNILEAYDFIQKAYEQVRRVNFDRCKKYQVALFFYLAARIEHIHALCQCYIYQDDLKELKSVGKTFSQAKKYCNKVWEIDKTILTSNRSMIDEIRKASTEKKKEINESRNRWEKQYRALDKRLHPWKYRLMWLIPLILLGVLGIVTLVDIKLNEIQEEPTTYKIEYFVKGDTPHNNLYANVNEQELEIPIPGDICIDIVAQGDFDNDGINDVLVRDIVACYGNACGDSFFFVCYKGEGEFKISEKFGECIYEEPIIANWKDYKSVTITYADEDAILMIKDRYICEKGAAVKVESIKIDKANAIQEVIRSDFFNRNNDSTLRLTIDLDENGIEDYIDCKLWPRGNALSYSIILNGEDLMESNTGFRIGVANSKTNGMHDLILDVNEIIKWDGEKYE